MGNSFSNIVKTAGITIGGLASMIPAFLVDLFSQKPDDTNDTMREIQKTHLRRLTGLSEVEARAEELAREREDAAKKREESALLAAEEARKQLAAAKIREEDALAKAEEASKALERGIRPVVMPTEAQYQAAMDGVGYDPEKLHFAFCGTSGSGKSTLINAFRGLKKGEKAAADVGVTETTSKVTRYPDPRREIPFSRFVWYDIPGAGTTRVPDWQYFNDQGLFVFDFIVMVYDVRFTKIDVGIIENCYRFNIPVFIVRSKADQHIDNMLKDLELDSIRPGDEEYEDIKAEYVNATKSDFDKHMREMAESPELDARDRQMILNQRVYIVSGAVVRGLSRGAKSGGVNKSSIIDEVLLADDMLRAAARRRYPKSQKGLLQKGRETVAAGLSSLRLGSDAPNSSTSM